MSKENGGPAFPVEVDPGVFAHGLTIRDYFAAKALTGALANMDLLQNLTTDGQPQEEADAAIAKSVYAIADAMIAERAK